MRYSDGYVKFSGLSVTLLLPTIPFNLLVQ